MGNNIQIFKNEQFGEIRTVANENNEPLFVANDVATMLGYANPRDAIANHVDEEDKATVAIHDGSQNRNMVVITESGFYSLVLSSKIEKAKKVKKWVTSEVLPSIRKNGGYIVSSEDDTPEIIMARAILVAQETIKKKDEKLKQLEAEKIKIIEETKPCVVFTESVKVSNTNILVRDLAKIITQNGIPIGAQRLYDWFVEKKYLIRHKRWSKSKNKYATYYTPTQASFERDLFWVSERPISNPGETPFTVFTTYVTGKGQIYFVNKFLKQKELV